MIIMTMSLPVFANPLLPVSASQHDVIAEKIVKISANFLGMPYQLEPLGEGVAGQFNQEPLYRFDGFDCETYVDTVLALAFTRPGYSFDHNMLAIRYNNGQPNFFTRNHFTDADWIPHNIQKGFVKLLDIDHQSISLYINKKQWFATLPVSRIKIAGLTSTEKQQKLNLLHQYANRAENTSVTLPYIPVKDLPLVLNYIPNGVIICIVKPDVSLISHMGLGIWKNHILYLREASSFMHKVVDIPLVPYLEDQPEVKGVVVLMVNQPH